MSPIEQSIVAGLIGALVVGVSAFSSYSKFKTLLKRCEPDDNTESFFTYKQRKYDFDVYVIERAEMLCKIKNNDLQKLLSKQMKKLEKSKNREFDEAEIAAIKKAISKIDD